MSANRSGKDKFLAFLQEYRPAESRSLAEKFELYLELLSGQNAKVNLVSRRMPPEDYWLYHFLDSILVLKCMEIEAGTALDFGSGGGLPGIPLKLLCPELSITLLDSKIGRAHV